MEIALGAEILIKNISVLPNEIWISLFSEMEGNIDGIEVWSGGGQNARIDDIALELNQKKVVIKDFKALAEAFYSLQDIEDAEICLLISGEEEKQRILLKTDNIYLENAYISHVFNDVYLCYSREGILGLKKEGKSKISLGKDCEVQTKILDNFCLNDGKQLLEISVPEEYREHWQFYFLATTAGEECRLASQNNYTCEGRYLLNENNCIHIKYEEIYRYVEWIGREKYVIFQLEARKRNQLIRFLLMEKGTRQIERYCYDVRKDNKFYDCMVGNNIFLRYCSNLGLTYRIIDKEEKYIEQFNYGISKLETDGQNLILEISARDDEGTLCGVVLKQGEYKKYLPCSIHEERKLTACMDMGNLWKEFASGGIEVYSVWRTDDLCEYLIENKIYRRAERDCIEANKLVCTEGIKLELQVSQTGTFKFQLNLGDPFTEKNILECEENLSFSEFLDQVKRGAKKSKGVIKCDIFDVTGKCFKMSVACNENIENIAAVYYDGSDVIIKKAVPYELNNYRRTFEMEFPCADDYPAIHDKPTYRVWAGICCERNFYLLTVKGMGKEHKSIDLSTVFDRRQYFYPPVTERIGSEIYNAIPYYALNGNFSLSITRTIYSYLGQLSNCIEDVSIRDGKLLLKAVCRKLERGEYKGFILQYRGKIADDIAFKKVEYSEILEEDEYYVLCAETEIKKLDLRMIYWDIFTWFVIDGQDYIIKVVCKDDNLRNRYQDTYNNDMSIINGESIIYPYVTKTNSVALAHREYYAEYDTVEFRELEQKAITEYQNNKSFYDAQNIYLIYEKYCTAAQDNGYYFFLYCMGNQVEKEVNGHIYYVIDKRIADYQRIKQYDDHVIHFGSYQHLLYLLAAKLYISTDTKEHAFVYRARGSRILPYVLKKEYVFLQHGVTGFKRVDHVYAKGKFGQCLRFVVSSNFEKSIIKKYFKYEDNEVITTGFARWDVLEDRSGDKRQIMIVPTWRSWLDDVENEVFVNSEYFLRYMELLNDPRLCGLLEKYDAICYFYIHIKFKDYISNFETKNSGRIHIIVFGEEPLNELLMESRLLITDYSSVSWDMYYQGKPVIFYQFDLDDYMYAHGSYMNLKEELFGDRGETLEELFECLEDYLAADFEMKPRYASQRKKYFKYFDAQNSARIWKEIKKCSYDEPGAKEQCLVTADQQVPAIVDYEYLVRECRNGHMGLKTLLKMIGGWLNFKLRGGERT